MAHSEAYKAVFVAQNVFVELYPTHHLDPPSLRRDICDIDCSHQFKSYLKWRAIQLAI